MVPEGWKRVPIKDACESIIDCVNKTAPIVDYETPFKMIRTTNVRDGRVDTENVRYVAKDVYLQWVRRGVPKVGDIIFTREAPVGEVGILEDDNGVFLGQRTMMYRAAENKANNYYLFYSLSSAYCQKQIEDLSNGGTVAHVRVPDCGEILINLPPLPEQKKIAQILSTWDKAITTTEQLLANSQQQKKALMQQLLTGKKRLLDDNGIRFSGEWKKLKLKKLFDFKRGKGLSKSAIKKDGQKKCILYGELFTCYPEVISNVLSRTNEGDSILSVKGDILIPSSTTTSGVDLANATALLESGVLLGGDINILRPKEKLSSRFFAYLLTHIEKYQIASFAQGITIIHIYGADLKKVEVKVPLSISEQQKIAAVLTSADQEIDSLQQKIEALKQEKKALMQQLLTGKRRVKVEDAA